MEVYRSEEFEEEVTVLQVGTQKGGGAATPGVRAAKSSEFGEGE